MKRRTQGRLRSLTRDDRVIKLERNQRRGRPRFIIQQQAKKNRKGEVVGINRIRIARIENAPQ